MTVLFSPFAKKRGADAAVTDEFGSTNWSDFDKRVNRLINVLRDAGLKAGDTFAILSGNRREYFEAIAAATHGGWRFVPVNWHWVGEEIAYVLTNSDSKALITEQRFVDHAREAVQSPDVPELNLKLIVGGPSDDLFQSYEDVLSAASDAEPADQSMGGPMFYTSGTTGRPKGVISSSSTADAPVEVMQLVGAGISDSMSLPKEGITLLEGPVYHSAQWAFSFLPMIAGSSVVMRHKFDAAETLELIDRHKITNIHLVPTQFVRLLRLDAKTKAAFDGSSLGIVWHGAAPCSPTVKREMIDWWGPKINEYYGSTEGSIISAVTAEEWLAKPGSLGKPLPMVEVMVVKERWQPSRTERRRDALLQEPNGDGFRVSQRSRENGRRAFGARCVYGRRRWISRR